MADNRIDGLNPDQERALLALLHQPTITKAAQEAEVGERTIYKWLDSPVFSAAYRKARRESFRQAIAMANAYAPVAMQTLLKITTDQKVSPSARVAAAQALLKFSRESIELDDVVARVEALEQAARQADTHPGQEAAA